MIRWLLSKSAEFRSERAENERLRELLREETSRALVLQDRLNAVVEDRQKLWEMVRDAASNERVSYQMQINAQWQRQGFGAPYPEAPRLPDAAAPHLGGDSIGQPMPELPSQRMQRMTGDFIRSYQQRVTQNT